MEESGNTSERESINRERQEDELTAIASIYSRNEFSYFKKNQLQCFVNLFLDIPKGLLEVSYRDVSVKEDASLLSYKKFFVEHLPPIRLYVQLPHDYPSKSPPEFRLAVSWLPPWEVSKICQELDEMWRRNRGNEILFLWLEFLKNDSLNFLDIRDRLDVSFLYSVHKQPSEYLESNLPKLCDARVVNGALSLHPKQYLTEYSERRHSEEFDKNFHACLTCLEEFSGRNCAEIRKCGHVCCKNCLSIYISTKIKEGDVKGILCPQFNCSSEILQSQVRELCPELIEKYEQMMVKLTLETMSDVTFCPRSHCQYPVTKNNDDPLATCARCIYNFCVYCRKGYHGVEPCAMTSDAKKKLVTEYQKATYEQRKSLEKIHGRKQLQIVVERYLTKEYLKNNAKSCPNCETLVEKVDGCNKMFCLHCRASFCWICTVQITTANPYEHFKENNSCFGRLFEGIMDEELYFQYLGFE